jgi:hypothetical protein
VWLRTLNTETEALRQILSANAREITEFLVDPMKACLIIARP